MRQQRASLLAEKQARERQLAKERDALATRLQFKEQEVNSLQEKCALVQKPQLSLSQVGSAGFKASPSAGMNRSQPQKTPPSSSSSSSSSFYSRNAKGRSSKAPPLGDFHASVTAERCGRECAKRHSGARPAAQHT